MRARSPRGYTQRLATGVGWISLVLGVAMTLDPGRSATILGWVDRGSLSRLVGAADLALGAGLLLGRRRAGWMLARALLNAAICLVYVRVLAEGGPRRGPDGRVDRLRLLPVAAAPRGRKGPAGGIL